MYQEAVSIKTSSPSEEETKDNTKDHNLRRYETDRKPTSPYDPYFEGEIYRAQLFDMNIEDKMTTINNMNSIALNAIFAQLLNTDLR